MGTARHNREASGEYGSATDKRAARMSADHLFTSLAHGRPSESATIRARVHLKFRDAQRLQSPLRALQCSASFLDARDCLGDGVHMSGRESVVCRR